LEADGKFLADMGNTATKSIDAVVTPHIEFSGTILPDHSGVQLTWNIIGAFYAQLEGSFDLLEPQGHTPPIPLGPTNPLPYSFTIKALDQNRKELARITVKRCWKAGSPISVGGNAASIAAVSPDGKRLYAFSGKSDSVSISIFDAVTLNPLATIPAGLYGPVAFAFSPDSSQVYVVTESATSPATITVIDANSHAVTSTINVAKSFQGKEQPSALAANDKYIFVKTVMGPVMLLVFDASTHALAWSDANPSPYFSLDISAGLALTAKRLYYGGINAVMTLDSQTLAHLNTTYVQIDEAGFDHFVAAPDDSRTFLAQPANGVSTFPGSDWVNPTHLPFKFGGFYPPGSSQYVFLACRGLAVTSDCRQVFALRVDQNNLANCGVQVAEFDPGSGVYVAGAALLQGEAMPVAIAMTPDNSRLFVGSLASIAVLDASYA
jgi:YVTN family beta-propeller protein